MIINIIFTLCIIFCAASIINEFLLLYSSLVEDMGQFNFRAAMASVAWAFWWIIHLPLSIIKDGIKFVSRLFKKTNTSCEFKDDIHKKTTETFGGYDDKLKNPAGFVIDIINILKSDITVFFIYNEKVARIEPFISSDSISLFEVRYCQKRKTYDSFEKMLHDKLFDGKSLVDLIREKIVDFCYIPIKEV